MIGDSEEEYGSGLFTQYFLMLAVPVYKTKLTFMEYIFVSQNFLPVFSVNYVK